MILNLFSYHTNILNDDRFYNCATIFHYVARHRKNHDLLISYRLSIVTKLAINEKAQLSRNLRDASIRSTKSCLFS